MPIGGKRPGAGRPKLYENDLIRKYKHKFDCQKHTATKVRNIGWHFTFEEWLAWWGDDIVYRGKTAGKLCMARNNDCGDYHPDNVHKATVEANHKEKTGLHKRSDEFRQQRRQYAIIQHANKSNKFIKKD